VGGGMEREERLKTETKKRGRNKEKREKLKR
jgi:hypothetical protein